MDALEGLDHIFEIFDCSYGSSKPKKSMEVKVKMECEGCERKVKKTVEGMKGENQVDIERKGRKVTVVGYVEPSKVVACIAYHTGKKVELWPYVPYDVVAHLYDQASMIKKNPIACSIM